MPTLATRIAWLGNSGALEAIAMIPGGDLDGVLRFTGPNEAETNPVGAGAATDILDRAAGDARYALLGSGVLSFNTRTGAVTLTSGDVTGALTYTPTSVTSLTGVQSVAAFKTGLSLNNVDNTADAAKAVLSATTLTTSRTIAISGKATGTATSFDGSGNITINTTAVTLVAGDIPTIAQSQVTSLTSDLALKAPLASPTFTGTVNTAALTTSAMPTLNSATNGGMLIVDNSNASSGTAGIKIRGSGASQKYWLIVNGYDAASELALRQSNSAAGDPYSAGASIIRWDANGQAITGQLSASTFIRPGSYTVATVPSASGSGAGATIYVSNETGGAVLAFSDATNWRRATDRAVIA